MLRNYEDRENYKHPFNMPVYNKNGAPMGRPNSQGPEDIKQRSAFYDSVKFHAVKVPFHDVDYDKGGAYWGFQPMENLYCVHAFQHIEDTPINYNAQFFCRAKSRNEAKNQAREYFGNSITFFK